jgi:hypothetical protein
LKILLVLKNMDNSKNVDIAIIPPKAPSTNKIEEQQEADPLFPVLSG